ncbi:MAG: hypothetical protein AB4042_21110 [Leptolyngbyaceae cyanobacterium]
MTLIFYLPYLCYLPVTLLSLGFGLVYLIRPTFMPDPAIALGKDWQERDAAVQTLILGAIAHLLRPISI